VAEGPSEAIRYGGRSAAGDGDGSAIVCACHCRGERDGRFDTLAFPAPPRRPRPVRLSS
jgi:hypothetical protein